MGATTCPPRFLAHSLGGYGRAGDRWYTADCRCTGGKRGRRDKAPVALRRRRTIGVSCRVTDGASPSKCADIRIWRCVAIRQYLKESNDLVLLCICQAEIPRRHVDEIGIIDLRRRPASYFFGSPRRTVSRSYGVWIHVTRIVEMYLWSVKIPSDVKRPPFPADNRDAIHQGPALK